jgi:hypothetical protein
MPYFSEREFGAKPRVSETLSSNTREGLLALIRAKFENGSLGLAYPDFCPDGNAVIGTSLSKVEDALKAFCLYSPLTYGQQPPSDADLFDLIEFVCEKIAKPHDYAHHSFFRHDHLSFDQEAGRAEFREEINKIFARNGLAFDLSFARNTSCLFVALSPVRRPG